MTPSEDRTERALNDASLRARGEALADKAIAEMGYQPWDLIPASVVRQLISASMIAAVSIATERKSDV